MARNWAITIGINGYHYLQRLNYAMKDADAVRQFFSEGLGFHQVYHFTDKSAPIDQEFGPALVSQPTTTTLRRFLRTRFEEPFLRDGDNLWFFFAGHGIRHESRDYLMPLDGDRGDLENSAIPLHYVSERLRRSGADNVILLIDACRSDKEGRRDGFGFGAEKHQGVITIFSCSPEEPAYEIEELQQGAFTHALLESLRLQGEGNCATVERLYQRLRYTVPQLTLQYKRVLQTPYGMIEPPSKNHLILLPRQATLTDVLALRYDALSAESRDPIMAKQLWIRVLMVSPGDPEAIAGIERLSRGNTAPQSVPPIPTPPSVSVASPSPSDTSGSRRVDVPVTEPEPVPQSPPLVQPIDRVERLAPPVQPPKPVAPTVEFEVVTISSIEKGLWGLGAPQVKTLSRRAMAECRREALGQGVDLELVMIPGGTFQMGSVAGQGYDSERPQHNVAVKPLWMGRYPVTQSQWSVVAALPKIARDLEVDPSSFKGNSLPVERVSWDDAIEFCQRLSNQTKREYRLPSEAEWEYACRAGTTTPFHFGETLTSELANYRATSIYGAGPKGTYREKTTGVGSFPTNAFGLYDMHGNVWEWCQDHWHENYAGAPTDGSAWLSSNENEKRLLRGGSWYDYPDNCCSAYRHRLARDFRNTDIGFRVVCVSS